MNDTEGFGDFSDHSPVQPRIVEPRASEPSPAGPRIVEPRIVEPRIVESRPAAPPRPRAIGSPLPRGMSSRSEFSAPFLSEQGNASHLAQAPPPGRALNGGASAEEPSSSMQRAVNALRSALPFVQRLLPLFDGNIASAVGNLLTPRPQASAPAPKVDLVPIEDGLNELQIQHRELRDQVMEQNTSLKRVEDQLEMVREATDRNTLEQQELLEDLKTFGNKVKMIVIIALGLVAIGFILNLILYLHIQRVLP